MIKELGNFLSNIISWHTNKKIVIIESDDWGSTRFRDKKTIDYFIKKGFDVSNCWMSMNDCLENNYDMTGLLEVLQAVKTKKDKHPVFTMFVNPANPDFEKIQNNEFSNYYYEPFTETLKRYNNTDKVLELYKKGISENLLDIGFHGREHLYVDRWMRDLKNNDYVSLFGFENEFSGFSKSYGSMIKKTYRPSYDLDFKSDLAYQKTTIIEGVNLMSKIFGQSPSVFVAPNGPLNIELLNEAEKQNLNFIQLPKLHFEPQGNGKVKRKFFYLGKSINNNQTVLTRNCSFEPSKEGIDWCNVCLSDIENAFKHKVPAVISSHRVNYVGGLDKENKDKGLRKLKTLLESIVKKWPEVEFMTSSQLGELISKKRLTQ